MVKTLAVKKFGEKAALQGLAKKTLANVDLHRQSKINSKTKPNEAISNYSFACVAKPLFWCMQGIIACNISARTKR